MRCQAAYDGNVLDAPLTPRAGRDAAEGVVTPADWRVALAARLHALPADGAANAVRLLAETFGAGRNSVSLTYGGKSRLKRVRIAGNAAALLGAAARLKRQQETEV